MSYAGACVVALVAALLSGCHRRDANLQAEILAGGSAELGRHLIYSYACGGCHNIPGVKQANGTAGPPLKEFGYRVYVAGTLLNTPENLVAWIQHPQRIQPGNAMPDLGITENQARDIAAYLYTLR